MAYPQAKIKFAKDNVIRIFHPETFEPLTYLTAAVAATGTTLTVKSNGSFSNTDPQDLLLFENLGNENAEIKRVNGAITLGTSLTSQAVTFAHPIDTPIYKILFDQVEISRASTATGSKTVIDTIAINVGGEFTDFVVTGTTDSFYFARFKNSLSTTTYFGAYSDALSANDYDPKHVGFIRRQAFSQMGEEMGGQFDQQWVYDMVYLGELDVVKSAKKQVLSSLLTQDYDMGNITIGIPSIALPTDIEDSLTNKSIFGLRIGTEYNLTYLDRPEFESRMRGVAQTTSTSEAGIGATSITLTDSRDFADSGSFNVSGTSYNYTTNTRSTGVLSGMTALSAAIPASSNVWQNITFGVPRYFTVKDGSIYFDLPPDSTISGRNIWLDYYKTPVRINSDGDSISINDPELISLYLRMKIRENKLGGVLPVSDPTFLMFEQRKAQFIENDRVGQKIRLMPDIPGADNSRNSWGR